MLKKINFIVLVTLIFIKRWYKKAFQTPLTIPTAANNQKRQMAWDFFLRRGFILVILAIVALIILIYRIQMANKTPTISEGIIGIYQPNDLPNYITSLISKPLVKLNKSGLPEADLASGWEVNKNARLYTFHLKNNLYWQDGTKVKSSDIQFNMPDVSVSYPDDQTIIFKLGDSFSRFPTLLLSPVFKGDSLIGVGEYKATEITFNSDGSFLTKIVADPVEKSLKLPKIVFRFYEDEQTIKTAFALGEVESMIGISDIGQLSREATVKIKQYIDYNKIVAIFYNTQDPVLSDRNFRKALSFSTPIIKNELWAKTSIPPFSWGYNANVDSGVNNPDEAQSYLKKVKADEKKNAITLTTISGLSDVANTIADSWKKDGIQTIVRVENGKPQNFQALLTLQEIPEDPDQYALWHSTQQQTNISDYQSKRVDDDLEKGRKLTDFKIRQEKYFDFQRVLLNDAPATFLYFPKVNIVYRKKSEDLLNKVLSLQVNRDTVF